ncbi:alpha-L-fucosidase [Nonomuraea sp. bgisy101]|uniref:alpha-L-fucosidase n=1 Tax=Nonomuraea sp. bgisy101 TaxID=3413784 RepID=UPI003D764279
MTTVLVDVRFAGTFTSAKEYTPATGEVGAVRRLTGDEVIRPGHGLLLDGDGQGVAVAVEPPGRGLAVEVRLVPQGETAERVLLLVTGQEPVEVTEGVTVSGGDVVVSGLAGVLSRIRVVAFDGRFDPSTLNGGRAHRATPADGPAEPGWRVPIGNGDDVVARAALVRPTERQLAWQALERTAFLHFGVNTFTGLEWGYGDEDPDAFQPEDLDTDQWARELKAAGFTLAILTVKHHDGFVLYPSALTRHCVASSSWRGGKGDVLREFADSMRAHGLKVGVYISPADEHEPTYANGSPRTPRRIGDLTLPSTDYGGYMLGQLHEVLTGYGPIDEVWFDGSQGRIPAGHVEEYDFDSWYALIRRLAPEAAIANCGPDVRWVGNESGLAREDEWNVVPVTVERERVDVARYDAPDLGGRDFLARAEGDFLQWWPAEVDVSIRPGWFYHAEQEPKSADELMTIYNESVGRGAVLLLNVPPDRRGRLADADVAVLREWSARIDRDFARDLAEGAARTADGDGVVLDLGGPARIQRIVLAEDLRHGQLVESLLVEAEEAAGWRRIAACGTVGAKRVITLPAPVEAARFRVRVLRSRAPFHLKAVRLFA